MCRHAGEIHELRERERAAGIAPDYVAFRRLPYPSYLSSLCWRRHAGEIHELRERERAAGIAPDHEVDAFMKASVRHGKRHNIRTDYVLRLLGLEVWIENPRREKRWRPVCEQLHTAHFWCCAYLRCSRAADHCV